MDESKISAEALALEDEIETVVRGLWRVLEDAGLPPRLQITSLLALIAGITRAVDGVGFSESILSDLQISERMLAEYLDLQRGHE